MQWEDELDYRDELVAREGPTGSMVSAEPVKQTKPLVRIYPTLFSYELDTTSGDEGAVPQAATSLKERWSKRLNDGFDAIHETGGLFLFAYEPETMGLSLERVSILEDFILAAKKESTWLATLEDVAAWWQKRRDVAVRVVEASEASLVVAVQHQGKCL